MIFEDLSKSKILIIYVYYQRKNEQKNQTNLSFFLKYGLDNTKWKKLDITTIVVIDKECEVIIPKLEKLHIIYSNSIYYSDYEGWYDGIQYINKISSIKNYDYLCLMNASTFGPVMDEDTSSHWLYPFYNKMILTNSIACSPYINNFKHLDHPLTLSCHFTFFLITNDLISLLIKNVLGKKINKYDAIVTGEEELTKVLTKKYNVCSLFYNKDERILDYKRREFEDDSNMNNLSKTIFIKNIWRIGNYEYPSKPVLYDYCNAFLNKKLQIKELLVLNESDIDFTLIPVTINKYYDYVYAEELILFPKKGRLIERSCVIYVHYDETNQLADYVIKGLKTLIYLGYDVFFYTSSTSLNIDLSILPFEVHFVKNTGPGSDYKILLLALKYIKQNNLNFDWIMFMNCSLLFPIHGIDHFSNTVLTMRKVCDYWGHWESNEISWHLVGVPFEFKSYMIETIISFLDNTFPTCNNYNDFVNNIETKICLFLKNAGFTYNVVIPLSDLDNITNITCPTHNPHILSKWIHNTNTFALKWKYVISYLDSNISYYLNDLTKYLYYGPNSFISKAEICGAFTSSKEFNIFDWYWYLDNYPDLRQAGLSTKEQAIDHWIKYGRKEGRIMMKQFDWEFYLNSYPDLRQSGLSTKEQAVDHWLNYGRKEGRICIKQ